MKNHGIIATEWQLQAASEKRLRAIILPMQPQPKAINGAWWWCPEMTALPIYCHGEYWAKVYQKLPYQIGDTVYFQEQWELSINDLAVGTGIPPKYSLLSQNRKSAEHPDTCWQWDWRPAPTMPIEAARYTFLVTDVHVKQMRDLTPSNRMFIKYFGWEPQAFDYKQIQKNWEIAWNTQFPDYPYHRNLFITILLLSQKQC